MVERPESVPCPLVSVITVFLDGELFLAEAIESVIAQSFANWELLLVDDGSGVAATTIAKDYATRYPAKIRYFEHPGHVNRGMSATRNLGIQHARGKFITFLDADDVLLTSKLADHMAVFDAHPEVGMVCGAAVYWNSWSSGRDEVVFTGHRQNAVVYPPDATLSVYPLGAAEAPCDPVSRVDLVRRIGGYEEQFIGFYEDQVFLSKVYLLAPVYFCGAVSMKYRQHPDSCCATVKKEGATDQVRLQFLLWFESYLKIQKNIDARVVSSLQRALRRYRRPFVHQLLLAPTKIRNRLRRLTGRVGQLVRRQAS